MNPYPFQEADLATLRRQNYVGLLNMGTGSGKTALTCWAIRDSGAKRVLILAPAQTIENAWRPTVEKLLGVQVREIGNGSKAKKEALLDWILGYDGIYIATHQFFTRSDVSDWSGDLLAVDEAHANGLATPGKKGQRKLSGYNVKDGEPMCQRFGMRLLLSGTALRNKFELAWSHSRFLWPHLDQRGQIAARNHIVWQNDRQVWQEIYTSQRNADGTPKKVRQFLGEKEPGRWVSEAPCVITHFKREKCCAFHPNGYLPLDEPTVIHETVPLLPAQKKAVAELEAMMMTWLDDNPLVAEIPLTKLTRIRQMTLAVPTVTIADDEREEVDFGLDAPSPVTEAVIEDLNTAYDDENVVVFTDSQKYARVLTHRLNQAGIPAFEFSGQTKKDREQNLARFGRDFRVVVGVLAAISEGVDTLQHAAKTEFWVSSSLDETLNEQGRGRLDRMGGIGQVERVYYHDDLGLSEGRFGEALERRLLLQRSLRKVA